ncbi:hypothetical protein G6F66_015331 [Rhizopus arrhizus]|nr:hypothetical protein G6F66_015331 [Rhizopus arrhizus]
MRVTAVMDPANPAHVKQFQIEGAETPDKYKPARVALPVLMADAAAKLEALRARDALSGALQVVQNGKVLLDWRVPPCVLQQDVHRSGHPAAGAGWQAQSR